MKKLFLASSCILILLCNTSFQLKDQWTQLLDKKLSQWEIYQSFRFPDGYKGAVPKDAKGNELKPIGYNIN